MNNMQYNQDKKEQYPQNIFTKYKFIMPPSQQKWTNYQVEKYANPLICHSSNKKQFWFVYRQCVIINITSTLGGFIAFRDYATSSTQHSVANSSELWSDYCATVLVQPQAVPILTLFFIFDNIPYSTPYTFRHTQTKWSPVSRVRFVSENILAIE